MILNNVKHVKLEKRKKRSNDFIPVCVLLGILVSAMVAAMLVSRKFDLDCFYSRGDYEIKNQTQIMISMSQNITYDTEISSMRIQDEEAFFLITSFEQVWNYLNLRLTRMNCDSLTANIEMYDIEGKMFQSEEIQLKEGNNLISLPSQELSQIRIVFLNQLGKSYYLKKVEVAENKWSDPTGSFFIFFVAILILYAAMCRVLYRKTRFGRCMTVYPFIEGMQKVWCRLSEKYIEKKGTISKSMSRKIRIVCFLEILLIMMYMVKFCDYHNTSTFKIIIGSTCFFMAIASFANLERKTVILDWNITVVKSWTWLCICMCISDFVVSKKIGYTGYWLFFIYTFFFWTWQNMEEPLDVIRDLIVAFEIAFLMAVFYCLAFQPITEGFSYVGIARNPNILGQYMALAWAIGLGLLFEEGRCEGKFWRLILLELQLAVSSYFAWISQCRSAILAMGGCFLITIMVVLKRRVFTGKKILGLLLGLALWVPVWYGADYIIHTNSFEINIEEDSHTQQFELKEIGKAKVYAKDGHSNKFINKWNTATSLDDYTSGRLGIYLEYIKNMNLWGHKTNRKVLGTSIGAHNMLLTIAYRYGLFSLIPYVLVLWSMLKGSIKRMRVSVDGKERYLLLILNAVFCTLVCFSLDDIEQPMRYIPWFFMYILIGFFSKK